MSEYQQRIEFEGNILITIQKNEVKLWVCNHNGENIFRFKAIGKVYKSGADITILSIKDDCLDNLEKRIIHLEKLNYGGLGDI